jgi:hypothetical protein
MTRAIAYRLQEGVGLAASRQRTGRSSGRFGFSWRAAVSLRKPSFWLLVFLGFPWILSSESRLIKGLRGKTCEKFLLAPFPGAKTAGTERRPCGRVGCS